VASSREICERKKLRKEGKGKRLASRRKQRGSEPARELEHKSES
jgi:hypothetical protein